MQLAHPLTMDQIHAAARLYTRLDGWDTTDQALQLLSQRVPGFGREAALLKVAAINQLYATQLYAVGSMANQVYAIFSSDQRDTPPEDLVERVALLGKRHHTSFAAKFCHFFVDAERFPIFDSYADWMVRWHLGPTGAEPANSHPYRAFLTNLHRLRECAGLTCSDRDIDRYFWMAGQYRWRQLRAQKGKPAIINAELRTLFNQEHTNAAVRADLQLLQ
jgi:hypothetical protein